MKILVVEDDQLVALALAAVLTHQNYVVEVASDGQAAWDLIETFDYDLILLDVILPKIDGIDLCRQIRSKGLRMPILLLTGCGSSHEKAIGLDAGADDYLVKPFDKEELVARIRALLRRGSVASQPVLASGHLRLDPISCEVTYGEEQLSLTPKEYGLLELFMRNNRRVFSCGMILEHLWSYEDTPGEEAVRTHIKGLRQKLKSVGAPGDLIETVYGIGYRLRQQAEVKQGEDEEHYRKGEDSLLPSFSKEQATQQRAFVGVAAIWNRFKGRVDEQVAVLEHAAATSSQKTLNQKLRKEAQKEAHTLAGSLGTFGFSLGSQIARKIEHLLKANKALTVAETSEFSSLVKQLRQEIEQNHHETLASSSQSQIDEHPLLLAIARNADQQTKQQATLAEQIEQEASRYELRVKIATSMETARNLLDREHPNVVLIDLDVFPNHEDSFSLLAELSQRKPPVPAIVFTEKSDFSNRLQVARSGGYFFLQKPMAIAQILEAVKQVLQDASHVEAHILAVDDDPKIGAVLQNLLSPWGIKVTYLEDPQRFWKTLEKVKPDLLILDVEIPEINGIEICKVVRNDPHWSELPILFLTVHNDANIVNQVFSVGADDFVSKPIVGPELVTRIINRLEKRKLRQRIAETQATKAAVIKDGAFQKSLQTRVQQQATVAKLGQSALSGTDLSSLMKEAVALVVENLEVEYCKILELLPEENAMVLRAGVGWNQELVGKAIISPENSGAGYTLLVQQPVIVEDLRTETRFNSSFLLQEHGIISGLSVPIPKRNSFYGVIAAYACKTQTFTQDDIHFVQSVANVLSAAIERQNTEEVLRKAKDELELRVAERTAELIRANEQLQSELNERHRTQEELRNSQARFAGIVSIADDAIICIDGNQCMTLFNLSAEKIFGYSAEEALGQPLDILLPMRYTNVHSQYVSDFGRSAKVSRRMGERREIYGRRKDGSEFPAEASISKLMLKDETIYTVYLQDVSDRKQVEKMKDEFVSVVSHELRTPLTSIHGSLGMLASNLIKPESEQGKRLLQIAVESTERLVRLINDVLDIERIESGKVKMEKQTCNVSELIKEAVNVIQPLADKAEVTLSVSSINLNVWADLDRIVQTITNLLSNAIKFSTPGSTVWVGAEMRNGHGTIGNGEILSPSSPQVLFTVKDTGRGIPSDKLDSIFERFQQVDSSDSRNHEGTGLGLAICRSIVQQHGGHIWVESTLSEGASFYFTLPLSSSSPVSVSLSPHLPLVLVCDDEPETRTQIQNLLENRRYRVITVGSGEEAITSASTERPDVILLDLLMPGMNGWEVIAALKEQPETQNIPIVICSVCTPTKKSKSSTDFVDWVSKPLEEKSLFESLKQALMKTSRRVCVLLVEDDSNLAEVLITLLEQHNIDAFLAKTGREAIRLSQEINPDLLILDLVLPEGDGFTVVEWLKQHRHLYKIPLMVYSAKELDDSEKQRLNLGHTEILKKGQVTALEFEQRVMDLLQRMTNYEL
ncbi:PAS domain S-box protein [Scytonema hofmannii PCC 7110]|uniref:Circadian input-output histidine kinase CikA n=1 Tax=Scytonema hofmannii PCC 7110 TaxID=128403 RepID=A0A139WTC7_9CYAN|nr:response regulator [Scytonema hofmannii]KYC35682.1 PAS domain S-box protein [Scytonema hofmannii PCC 7110]